VALGEMARATILRSQRVLPTRLSASGFDFEYPELEAGLSAILTRS
jgi:NAD dependent epimerase/dehydratase family enzyme